MKQEKRDQTNSNQFTLFNYPDPIIVSDDIVIEPFNPVLTETQWLSDAHLDLVIDHWTRICPWYSHCQILSLLKIMELQRHNVFLYQTLRPQIYFVYAYRNHWYILTNIDNERIQEDHENQENDWFIYDSLNDASPENLDSSRSILKMIYPDEICIYVSCVQVIEQENDNDCGLFAIAYAQSLLERQEPAVRNYENDEMRLNFNCFASSTLGNKWLQPVPSIVIPDRTKTVKTFRISL